MRVIRMWALAVAVVLITGVGIVGCRGGGKGKTGSTEDRRQEALKQQDEMKAVGKAKMESGAKKAGP